MKCLCCASSLNKPNWLWADGLKHSFSSLWANLAGFAKPKAPKITQSTWQRFLSLADSILRINETIQVLPEPYFLSLKLESIHPVNLQKCHHWVASNPNCPAKGSIHFECSFTSRMFDAQLLQHVSLVPCLGCQEWGSSGLVMQGTGDRLVGVNELS